LKADEGRLWNRTEAALQVNPNRPEVQAWAALILAAGQGQNRANSWLKEAKITPDNLTHIQSLLRQLNGEVTPILSTHPSRIIGSAQPISSINSGEWLQLDSKADLKAVNNQWYQVEVSAFHDGKRWLNWPFWHFELTENFSREICLVNFGDKFRCGNSDSCLVTKLRTANNYRYYQRSATAGWGFAVIGCWTSNSPKQQFCATASFSFDKRSFGMGAAITHHSRTIGTTRSTTSKDNITNYLAIATTIR
jgi:hypothetical protein